MGIFIYAILTLFSIYMAFELGQYVSATGDRLPLLVVLFLVFIALHCIKEIRKAIRDNDLDMLN